MSWQSPKTEKNMLNELIFLELSSNEIGDEKSIDSAAQRVAQAAPRPVVMVAAMGQTYKTLLEAGEKSADQDLVLASALAEGIRTYHVQLAQQIITPAIFRETRNILSGLFEELADFLKGLYLLEEFSAQARQILERYGERAAAVVISAFLRSKDIRSASLATKEVFQEPDDLWKEVQELLQKGIVPVLPLSLHRSEASRQAKK
ncbi:MAG: hypothetical protein EHM23_24210 [Acidobacteria bacterium]|nr:MAG: hypothetical protein EHM23_24210 [Acidobacteriota bacterium]